MDVAKREYFAEKCIVLKFGVEKVFESLSFFNFLFPVKNRRVKGGQSPFKPEGTAQSEVWGADYLLGDCGTGQCTLEGHRFLIFYLDFLSKLTK